MVKENKARIIRNLDNVSKHLPSDREFTVLGEKHNDFSSSRFILNCLFLGLSRIFTPVISRKILSYLSHHHKRMLSIVHPYFNFKTANKFMVVNNFANLICSSWNDFYVEIDQLFTIALEIMFSRNRASESVNAKFEEDSRRILKEKLNYIGCKAALGYLLYCNRLIRKQYCVLCTMMISRESNLAEILSQLHSVSSKELLEGRFRNYN